MFVCMCLFVCLFEEGSEGPGGHRNWSGLAWSPHAQCDSSLKATVTQPGTHVRITDPWPLWSSPVLVTES